MKGIPDSHTTNPVTYVLHRYCLIKNPETNTMTAALVMVWGPVAVLRVSSCCRCPWKPQRLSQLGHRPLEHLLASIPSIRFPFSPVPKNKTLHAVFGTVRKKTIACRLSSIRLAPLVDARSPSCFVVETVSGGTVPSRQA